MKQEKIVRTIEIVFTALALTLALGIIVPAQDASANHAEPEIQVDRYPSLVEHYATVL